jgi:hypothetical protein
VRRPTLIVPLAALLAGLAGACGAGGSGDGGGAGIFIAFGKDFAEFRQWPSQSIESPDAQAMIHVAGPGMIFINQIPTADGTSFPVGTMIVKMTDSDGKIFARAKRGGGYNRTGALDWEWFELTDSANGVAVKWHGVGPPAGEKYGGDPHSGCNLCHGAAAANDFVLTSWLQLGHLDAGGMPPVNEDAAADAATTNGSDAGQADTSD